MNDEKMHFYYMNIMVIAQNTLVEPSLLTVAVFIVFVVCSIPRSMGKKLKERICPTKPI